jgi:shikimate kinase
MSTSSPNIVLIGFMGSGKTTVSALLGTALGRRIIEMDVEIAQRAGYPSVAKIIDELGEPHFRELESTLAQELSRYNHVVISTGGGIISRAHTMELFKRTGATIVFLECSFERVQERLSAESELPFERPLFRDIKRARELFALREPLYREWADIIVPVDTLSPSEVRDRILQSLSS